MSLIGRPLIERSVDHVMDLDLVCILRDPVTPKHLESVEAVCNDLSNLECKDVAIVHDLRVGPVKPLTDKKVTVLIHLLLHSVDSYRHSPLLLVQNSWQHEAQQLWGMRLEVVRRIDEVTLDMVQNGALGVRHCLELLEQRRNDYLGWTEIDGHNHLLMKPMSTHAITEHDLVELAFYGVLRSASNLLRCRLGVTQGIGIDEEDMHEFQSVFDGFRYASLPLELWRMKRVFRHSTRALSRQNTRTVIDCAGEFLTELDVYVNRLLGNCVEDRGDATVPSEKTVGRRSL